MMPQAIELKAERPFETRACAGMFSLACATVQPNIDSRRLPVIRLIQNIEIAVTIEVRELAFVKSLTRREDRFTKTSLAISIENPRFALGIVGIGPLLGPL